MVVVKRINNNAVLCVDSAGHQVVALGRGLAQATLGSELDLDLVDHTFYDVEPRYVELMRDLDLAYLEVSAQIIDMARSMLTYELSPNIEVALADHIQFAVQRMREHIYLSTPLSYDLQQNYPLEYKIAQWALTRIDHLFEVTLPRNEIAGIAMCIINGAYSSAGAVSSDSAETQDRLLEDITRIVEETMGAAVDREGFGFARFATHVQYLIRRVATGDAIASENSGMYALAATDNPQASTCVEAIAALLMSTYQQELIDEEKLYLILHINRICSHPSANEG
ncbi:PRD domain-containing protein [Collinsella intestinalis]|uniref:PRD domain-containing protein n=1 Tax=Collinsella intestinalis TaxID=147207 RepID=UPI001958D32F|nr:PRD domain-containing protein [Collinsella intestinalis]